MTAGIFMPVYRLSLGGAPGGVIQGEITIGTFANAVFGYSEADNPLGAPPFGSISGSAADYIDGYFAWSPFSPPDGNIALAKNTTVGLLTFQGQQYTPSIHPDLGRWVWMLGSEVSNWPSSGTYPFEITDP